MSASSLTVNVLAGSASLSLSSNCTFRPVRSLPLKRCFQSSAANTGVVSKPVMMVRSAFFMVGPLVGESSRRRKRRRSIVHDRAIRRFRRGPFVLLLGVGGYLRHQV